MSRFEAGSVTVVTVVLWTGGRSCPCAQGHHADPGATAARGARGGSPSAHPTRGGGPCAEDRHPDQGEAPASGAGSRDSCPYAGGRGDPCAKDCDSN